MPTPGTLHDAFLDELRDAYDAERQVTKALPTMVKAATSPKLKAALEAHLEETHGQVSRLEKAFTNLDQKVQGKHCGGMAGILKEGKAVMEGDLDKTAMDACLIASAQRVEHYEMAAYGTLVAWARSMAYQEVADLLEETLNEEKSADSRLSLLARDGINKKASAVAAAPMASSPRQRH